MLGRGLPKRHAWVTLESPKFDSAFISDLLASSKFELEFEHEHTVFAEKSGST